MNRPTLSKEMMKETYTKSYSPSGTPPSEKGDLTPISKSNLCLEGQEGFTTSQDERVQRNLQPRHISMIAIGGTIGTGLFLGIGNALHQGGPLGLLLGYIVM